MLARGRKWSRERHWMMPPRARSAAARKRLTIIGIPETGSFTLVLEEGFLRDRRIDAELPWEVFKRFEEVRIEPEDAAASFGTSRCGSIFRSLREGWSIPDKAANWIKTSSFAS
jgi:hypothetical protein